MRVLVDEVPSPLERLVGSAARGLAPAAVRGVELGNLSIHSSQAKEYD